MKDVTEEIEDDAQLEGMKGEKQDEKQPPEPPKQEEDTAREVGFDLDTEAQAVPQDEKEDRDQQEKEGEDELDRQQGEVDLNNGGKLDEKLWNGDEDEDDKKDDEKEDETEKEKEQGQQEDIEAHGAHGEGEADNVAADESKKDKKRRPEDKPGNDKDDDKGEDGADEQDEKDGEEQNGEQEKAQATEYDPEKDGQFDVNLKPEAQGQDEGEGEGEGQGEGEQEEEFNCDEDLDLEGDGAEGEEGDGEEGDGDLPDAADMDVDEDMAPPEPADMPEEDAVDDQRPQQLGQEPGAEGEHEEQGSAEKEDQQGSADPAPTQGAGEDKAEETPAEGDPAAQSGTTDTAPKLSADERMFGGTSGASTSFENSQEKQDAGDATAGGDQGGMTDANDSKEAAAEMPSQRPDRSGGGGKSAPPQPENSAPDEASERHLQKVDILRGADEGETAGSEEKQAGAEQGLHIAVPEDGEEALGECADMSSAPNKALGVSQQEGEEGQEGEDAAAMEQDSEEKQGEERQSLDQMHLQQMDVEATAVDPQAKPLPEASEDHTADATMEQTQGGANVVHAAAAELPTMRPDAELKGEEAPPPESEEVAVRRRKRSEEEVRQLWNQLERVTSPLSAMLCEQLRTILEPTMKGRLQGYYRTGKRISMRRVIPFIASNYRRDKIWLRRTKPSKREYQVIVAIDNSRSMSECGVGPMALQTLCTVCQALAQLEVGEYAVMAFGSTEPQVLLPLGAGQPHAAMFGFEQAAPLLTEFTFEEESVESHNKSFADMMRLGSTLFDERGGSGPTRPFCQVMLIISDGRFNKAKVRPWVHTALARQQLPLLVIVDSALEAKDDKSQTGGKNGKSRSVFELKNVSYEGGKCNVVPYLQDFPFPYYVVVQDLQTLPSILSDVLKQWFELVAAA